MEYAGLIHRQQFGPDMPLDARYLVRLPLIVLRRVVPEPDAWNHAINALEEIVPPNACQKWVLDERLPGNQAVFFLVDESVKSETECDDCDGKGYFYHGSHEYECKGCDGEGSFQLEIDNTVNQATVTIDGRIIESPTVH